ADDALASFRQALALNPENTDAAERSRAAVAGVPAHEPPAELLVELYEGALAKDPKNLAIRRRYAELCAQRKLPCARTQYEIVLRDAPGDEEAIHALKGL